MFGQSTSPITVVETAPNGSGVDVFWICGIQNPGEFFSGCESEDEASDHLIESDQSPGEQIETCGRALVLDHLEDLNILLSSIINPLLSKSSTVVDKINSMSSTKLRIRSLLSAITGKILPRCTTRSSKQDLIGFWSTITCP